MPTYSLDVDQEHNNLRLDVFLTQNLSEVPSRTFIKRIIDSKKVLVNGHPTKAHYKVSEGDAIQVEFEKHKEERLEPEDISLDIFYEDDDIIVVNKPVGMLVHPVRGCHRGTLVNALLHHSKNLSDVNQSNRPGIVHRLDRETSGLLVVAKNNKAHVRLSRQFEKHRVKKRYVAVVEGIVEFDEGVVDASLGSHPLHHDKRAVVFYEAKEAQTYYRVIKRSSTRSLVALFPRTGRTHQLRVHMVYLGYPILGDDKYGTKKSFHRLALHAQSIGFQHPCKPNYIEFSSVIPDEFYTCL